MSTPESDSILNSLETPVLVVEAGGRIVKANSAAGRFWKLSAEKLATYSLAALFGVDSLVLKGLSAAMKDESSFTVDPYLFDQGEGLSPLVLRLEVTPLAGESKGDGLKSHAVVTFWDLTRREKMDQGHNELLRMDAIEHMVRRLAHEIRNPLSGIKGATQLLNRRVANHPTFKDFPQVILKELERMERLTEDLLVQGGGASLIRKPFNVHELLDRVIWFQTNAGAEVEFIRQYDPSLPHLNADEDRLHQVFLNLIQNSVQAGGKNSKVTITTRIAGGWQEREAVPDPRGYYFMVEVHDEGTGVPHNEVGKLFMPYFTTKKGGTGLGLSISYQLVRAHGGKLSYHRGLKGGAVFSVAVPLEE